MKMNQKELDEEKKQLMRYQQEKEEQLNSVVSHP